MPTLQDVARCAGVSAATVSKVLSNTPYFTEETRNKVLTAAQELDYLPNLAARALSSGKSHIITVVFPYVYDAIFEDPLVMSILEGIESECNAHGYNLLLSTPRLNENGPDDHYHQLMSSGYVDGVITIDNVPIASVAQVAVRRKIPVVVAGYHPAEYWVRTDDQQGGRLLMEHILGLGHRDIGLIRVLPEINFAVDQRVGGLRIAAHTAGLDFDTIPKATGNYSSESGAKATRELLTRYPHITAILCMNDRMAMGAVRQAHKMGRRVPDNLSIAGYDDIPSAEIFSPPLTTINQQASILGRTAAQMLFDILNGKQPTPITLPVRLIHRSSTAVLRP